MADRLKIFLLCISIIVFAVISYYMVFLQPIKLANKILLEGGYPELPKGAKIISVSWDNRWNDTAGLLPIAKLSFSTDKLTLKLWADSIEKYRNLRKNIVLERKERIEELTGEVEIELMLTYK